MEALPWRSWGIFLLKNRSDIYQKAIILSIHNMRIKYAICS